MRPWLWLGPALGFLTLFLVYPTFHTIGLSFVEQRSGEIGLANYQAIFADPSFLIAVRNTAIWVVVFPVLAIGFGLLIAVLADRVPYEDAVKAAVFLPMATSFVAAGVIWRFMYAYRPPPLPQTGTVNALLIWLIPGFEPQAWLVNAPPLNTLALLFAAVWVWTGFCTVILSASLKAIPVELVEAARVDGASEWQLFARVLLPLLIPTIAVMGTTLVIFALKAFDLVYVMTNGNFETDVIANRMYKELFNVRDFGRASAIAVVLLAAITPIMLLNIKRFQQEGARG
jgi:alpha-glucoside transport system permease protein